MTDFSDAFINQEGDQQKYFSGRANAEDIKGIFTSCEECVFSVYENNTQISCKLDRIEKFKSKILNLYHLQNMLILYFTLILEILMILQTL